MEGDVSWVSSLEGSINYACLLFKNGNTFCRRHLGFRVQTHLEPRINPHPSQTWPPPLSPGYELRPTTSASTLCLLLSKVLCLHPEDLSNSTYYLCLEGKTYRHQPAITTNTSSSCRLHYHYQLFMRVIHLEDTRRVGKHPLRCTACPQPGISLQSTRRRDLPEQSLEYTHQAYG